MAKRNNKKFFVNPLRNPGIGLRSGKDIKAGKIIKVDKHGFENFDDYFSESDADITRELNKSAAAAPKSVHKEVTKPVPRNVSVVQGVPRSQSVTNSTVTSEFSKDDAFVNPLAWIRNKNIGRRTGRNITEGKVIRKDEAGFECFEDYWSESEAESMMMSKSRISFNKTTNIPPDVAEESSVHSQESEVEIPDGQESGLKESESTTDSRLNATSDHVTADSDSDVEGSSCHDVDKENDANVDLNNDDVREKTPTEPEKSQSRPVLAERVVGTSSTKKSGTGKSPNKSLSPSVKKSVGHVKSTLKDKSAGSIEKILDNSEHVVIAANTNTSQERCIVDKTQVTDNGYSRTRSQLRSAIEIGGNVTGSITKCDDQNNDSAEVAMSFKTRKRLSYSVAEQTPNKKKTSYRSTTESIQEEDYAMKETDCENVVVKRKSHAVADNVNTDSDGAFLSLMMSVNDKNASISSAEDDIVIVDNVIEYTNAGELSHGNSAKKRKSTVYNKRKSEIEKRRSAMVTAIMHEYSMDSFSSQEEEIKLRESPKKWTKASNILQRKSSTTNTTRKPRERKASSQDIEIDNATEIRSVKGGKSRGREKNKENNSETRNGDIMDDEQSGKELVEKTAQDLGTSKRQSSGAKYESREVKTLNKNFENKDSNSTVSNLQKSEVKVTKGKKKGRGKQIVKKETQNEVSLMENNDVNEEIETTRNISTRNHKETTSAVNEILSQKNRRKTFAFDSADEDSDVNSKTVDSSRKKNNKRNSVKKSDTSVSVVNVNENDDMAENIEVSHTKQGMVSNKKTGKSSLSEDAKKQSDSAKCSVTEDVVILNNRSSYGGKQSTIHEQLSEKTLQKSVNLKDVKKSTRKRSLKPSKSLSVENVADEVDCNEGLNDSISEMKTKGKSPEKCKDLEIVDGNFSDSDVETVSKSVVSVRSSTVKRTKASVSCIESKDQTESKKTKRSARESQSSVTSSEETRPSKYTPDKKLRKSRGSLGTAAMSSADVDDAHEKDDGKDIDDPFGDKVNENPEDAVTEVQNSAKIVSKRKKRAGHVIPSELSLKLRKQSRQTLSGMKTRKRSRSRSIASYNSRRKMSKDASNKSLPIVKVPTSKKSRKSSEVSQSLRKLSINMTSPVGCSTRISNMLDTSATPVQDISDGAMEQIFNSGVSFRQKSILKKVKEDEKHSQPAVSREDDVEQEAGEGRDDDRETPQKVSRMSLPAPISSPGLSLTPCLVKPGDKKKKKQRRVTISKLVQQKSYNLSSDSTGIEKSSNDLTVSSAPVHIFETTTSATPQPLSKPQKPLIILPEPEMNGLRRSQRTRVKPLEWYKGERVRYKPRKSGGFVISGVIPSREKEILEMEEKKRKLRQKRNQRKKKTVRGSPPRNLSMHTEIPSQLEVTISDEVVVVNPETDDEVYVEIFAPKDVHAFVGPTGEEPRVSDPFLMSRVLDQKAFGSGVLLLRPLKEKSTQLVSKGSLILVLERGKVCATIHRTSLLMEAGDSCFIPRGNTYSLKNLRGEEAKFYYTIIKHCEENESSVEQG